MKRYAKAAAIILSVLMLFSSLYITPYASDVKSGDFIFAAKGSSLTLKKYSGKGGAVTVPSSVGGKKVTAVGNQAFAEYYEATPDNRRITKVVLPSTVKEIGNQAFQECTKLVTVEMIGVRKIGEAAFWYCTNLKNVAVSSSLTQIASNAFGKCANVKIFCEKGSAAEKFAKSHSLKYGALYPSSISLPKSSFSIEKGASVTLSVIVSPSDAYFRKFTWSMSGKNASVSKSGKVTGKRIGTDMVTCTSVFGDATAECFVKINMPTPKKPTAEKKKFDSLTLSWGKASGATGYEIQIQKNCKWVKLGSTKKLTYTVKGLSPDTAYKFRIRAYLKQDNFTYYSTWVKFSPRTLKLGNVKNVRGGAYFYDELSFLWDKAAHASGYEVYVYSKSKKKYVKLLETKKTEVREMLSEGTIRKYKVRAFANVGKKRIYSSFTDPFTFATQPLTVTKLKVSAKTKNSITLKWNSVKNASGYKVYNVKNGEYIYLKTVTDTTCTLTGLGSSAKYSYSVAPYINTTLKTVYGDCCDSVSAITDPAVTVAQSCVNSFTGAMKNIAKEKEIYVSLSTKINANLVSCSGSSAQKSIISAYVESFNSNRTETFSFTGGYTEDGLTPTQLFVPADGFVLRDTDVKSAEKVKDGSGYLMNVILKSETAGYGSKPRINSGVWGMIDENEIAQTVSDDVSIKSLSVNYSATQFKAKINSDGNFDTITLTVPFEITAVCTVGSSDIKTVVSGKLIKDYIIVRW